MKSRLALLVVAAVLLSLVGAAQASVDYPQRVIRLIVPFPAGGTTDILARPLADELSKSLGQPVIIENRPGAGGNLGADVAAKAEPDGYTLFVGAVHNAIAASLYKQLNYNLLNDFRTIAVHALVPHILITKSNLNAGSVSDLVRIAHERPGALTYASGGFGTSHHIISEMFNIRAKTNIVHIPYKGGIPATADLLGGHVDIMFETSASALSNLRTGRVKGLAVTSAERSSALPNVPTLAESGFPGFDALTWYAIMAPGGVPDQIAEKLNKLILEALNKPRLREIWEQQGANFSTTSPAEANDFVRSEVTKWADVVKASGLEKQ